MQVVFDKTEEEMFSFSSRIVHFNPHFSIVTTKFVKLLCLFLLTSGLMIFVSKINGETSEEGLA